MVPEDCAPILYCIRPSDKAEQTALFFQAHGLAAKPVPYKDVVFSPFDQTLLDWDVPLLLSSPRAVEAIGKGLQGREVFCAGQETARQARHYGANILDQGEKGLSDLFGSIYGLRVSGLMYVHGPRMRYTLSDLEGKTGKLIRGIQVYDLKAVPFQQTGLNEESLKKTGGCLLFSQDSVLWCEQNLPTEKMTAFCLSPFIAESCRPVWSRVVHARTPDLQGLLEKIQEQC